MPETIPIFHCFDENYVLPAAVAFDSMLRTASARYKYQLFVAGPIARKSQDRLQSIVSKYRNACLDFLGDPKDFSKLFESTGQKGHYSAETYYKFLVPEMLPEYPKAIVTDVDVVWLDDISVVWEEAGTLADCYLAGIAAIQPPPPNWLHTALKKAYEIDFSPNEIDSLQTGGGLWVFNLELMRQDSISTRFLQCAEVNKARLRQAEQDVVNLVTSPRQQFLAPRSMVCNYFYEFYPDLDSTVNDLRYSAAELREAHERPIQLHYAGSQKPWTHPGTRASHHWFRALVHTAFLADWLALAQDQFESGVESVSIKKSVRHLGVLLNRRARRGSRSFERAIRSGW